MVNVIDIQTKLDVGEEAVRERLAGITATPINEVASVDSPIAEKVGFVVEQAVNGVKLVVSKALLEERTDKKGHTTDSFFCRQRGNVIVLTQKRKRVRLD